MCSYHKHAIPRLPTLDISLPVYIRLQCGDVGIIAVLVKHFASNTSVVFADGTCVRSLQEATERARSMHGVSVASDTEWTVLIDGVGNVPLSKVGNRVHNKCTAGARLCDSVCKCTKTTNKRKRSDSNDVVANVEANVEANVAANESQVAPRKGSTPTERDWTHEEFERYLESCPSAPPTLISIDKIMYPTRKGNPTLRCTFQHSTSGQAFVFNMNSSLMYMNYPNEVKTALGL